jgi:polyhydroxybutyrate depolymerase
MKALIVLTVLIAASAWLGASCGGRQIGLGGKDVRIPLEWVEGEKPLAAAGDYGRKLEVGGRERYYELHLPKGYAGAKPTPLVFVFHGGGSYPAAIRYESGMDATADRHGFAVVYPAGTSNKGFKDRLLMWNDGRPFQDGTYSDVDDHAFFDAVLADVSKLVAVDPERVYACGFSNGAQFTYTLAQKRSDRIASIAAVAGQRPPDELYAPPPRAISVMQFAGKQDTVGPYEGGEPKFGAVLEKAEYKTLLKPVQETVRAWAQHAGCAGEPSTRKVGQAIEQRWGPCRDGAEVVLWTLEDGGHTWPGGKMMPASVKIGLGNINRDVDASAEIWSFFAKHPRP